jgi:excisionase family DNA binding protein
MEHLLKNQDVADYLGVPIRTVYAWRHKGEGPRGFKVGRHIRYRREDVDAWLAERADDRTAA